MNQIDIVVPDGSMQEVIVGLLAKAGLPVIIEKKLTKEGRYDINVVPSFGNTEHKIGFGATAIVDVTESGSSLKENQLEIIHEIMKSNTVVVANLESLNDESKRPYIDCFVRLIKDAFHASRCVMLVANVPENVLDKASRIIGGLKGPSCSPLVGVKGWFALQSVVSREDEQKIIFDLLQIGVTDIIVNRDIPLTLELHLLTWNY